MCPACGAETELRKVSTFPGDPARFTALGPLQRPHDVELDMLIARIGDAKARELSDLALRPSSSGMCQEAFDELAMVVKGYPGIYGSPTDARAALEALRRHYAAQRR